MKSKMFLLFSLFLFSFSSSSSSSLLSENKEKWDSHAISFHFPTFFFLFCFSLYVVWKCATCSCSSYGHSFLVFYSLGIRSKQRNDANIETRKAQNLKQQKKKETIISFLSFLPPFYCFIINNFSMFVFLFLCFFCSEHSDREWRIVGFYSAVAFILLCLEFCMVAANSFGKFKLIWNRRLNIPQPQLLNIITEEFWSIPESSRILNLRIFRNFWQFFKISSLI